MKIEGLVKVWIKSVLFVYLWTESHITFIAKWRTKSYLHIIAIVPKMFNYFIFEQDILFFPLVSMWRNTNALSNCINCPERRVYLLQKFRRFRRGKTNQSCLNSQHRESQCKWRNCVSFGRDICFEKWGNSRFVNSPNLTK